ncbi:hypothetical protein BZA70DRAFT_271623 [Myxozyma melibiosi]|uniref:Mitochondrial import receptor subunit TOM20 n=1 Tax=Myxozyma melibiosi TaxID=54550 RepID=A0ABR1FCI7_9ASCO
MRTSVAIASAAALGAVSYAIYFDYQRRNSPEFRRRLRKSEKKYQQSIEKSKKKAFEESKGALKLAIITSLTEDPIRVSSAQEFEGFMMKELTEIDAYIREGGKRINEMVVCMYRLLVVHPMPQQIMEALKETVPAEAMLSLAEVMKDLPLDQIKPTGSAEPETPAVE